MYWLSLIRPLSPSFFRTSRLGTALAIIWMMMLALIYGMMLSANTVMRPRAPPLNMLNMPRMPPPLLRDISSPITEASTPGSGM